MKDNLKEHWNKVYSENDEKELSWYQEKSVPSLKLLSKASVAKDSLILDIGSGASVFVKDLLDLGYTSIIASDISEIALNKSRNKLGKDKAKMVTFIVDDVTNSTRIKNLKDVSVWHDRAVLHFLTKSEQRKAYLETLNKVLKTNGYAIIGTFSLEGPRKCSGLEVVNYSADILAELLGISYKLEESFNYTHQTFSGNERPFVYALFKKVD